MCWSHPMIVGSPPSTRSWTQLRDDICFGEIHENDTRRQGTESQPRWAGENEEPSLTAVEIGRRAYEIFVERGSVHGHDLDDWLKAEHELKEKRTETGKAA